MSFLDLGGGGGDAGGGKSNPSGGGFPGGGSGPGGGGDPLASDPALTGDTGMSGFPSVGGTGTGSGMQSTDASTGFTGNPVNDPNVGAPQSQAPAPGTTATSFGGVPSAPQTDAQLQQILKQLSGVRNQASPLEAAAAQGQSYGGAPTTTSTASQTPVPPGTATELQQQQAGATDTSRFSPEGPPPSGPPPTAGAAPTGATGGYGGQGAQQGAQPAPSTAGATPTGATGGYGTQGAQMLMQSGPDQPVPPPAAEPKPDTATPPPAKTDDTTTATTPPATGAKGATPPATGAIPPGQGGYGGGSPTQQQQLSPAKLILDAVRALFGDPSGLSQDLQSIAGQANNWESPGNPPGVPPWAPGYGPQSRIDPNSPQARRIAAQGGGTGRTGRTAAPPQDTGPSIAQQQGDVQAAISKGDRDPFGASGWPGPGQPDPLAPSFGTADTGTPGKGAGPLVANQEYRVGANGIAPPGKPTQASVDVTPLASEANNRNLMYQAAQMGMQEVSTESARAQMIQLETARNRALYGLQGNRNQPRSLAQALTYRGQRGTGYGHYYPDYTNQRPSAQYMKWYEQNVWNPVMRQGVNVSDVGWGPMTGNASNQPGNAVAAHQYRQGQRGYDGRPMGGDQWFRERVGPNERLPTMPNTTGPRSSLEPPARATGLDLLNMVG